jgi:pimeloyl-ACP methyl ester carboxylesterase
VIPKTRWATTADGANIAYQDFGEGQVTLVVIHGWISHLELYWEQPRFVRFMRRLSAQMRVLHFDKRGTGMSDRFARVPDLETRMDDLRAVMDAAGMERAALLGWGFGGPPSALFFAATQPTGRSPSARRRRSSPGVFRVTGGAMTRPRTNAL